MKREDTLYLFLSPIFVGWAEQRWANIPNKRGRGDSRKLLAQAVHQCRCRSCCWLVHDHEPVNWRQRLVAGCACRIPRAAGRGCAGVENLPGGDRLQWVLLDSTLSGSGSYHRRALPAASLLKRGIWHGCSTPGRTAVCPLRTGHLCIHLPRREDTACSQHTIRSRSCRNALGHRVAG